MENDANEPGPEIGPDDQESIAERLKRLEEEAKRLRDALAAESAAKPQAQPEHEPEPADEALPKDLPPATAEQIEKADRLIAQAHLARTRGQKQQAVELLKQAEQMAPNAPNVLAAVGSDLLENRRLKEAEAVLRRAVELAPGNIPIERKHAEAVYALQVGHAMATSKLSELEYQSNAKSAALLSVLIPGLGQIVSGEKGKGLAFMISWLVGVVWLFADRPRFKGLITALSGGPKRVGDPGLDPLVFVPIAIIVLIWIMSMFDAASKAKRFSAMKGDRPERPTPPVDLPY